MAKRIDISVPVNPQIEELMNGFVPTIGNSLDISIYNEWSKLLNLYTLLSDGDRRAKDSGKEYKPSKEKLTKIRETEKNLICLMKERTKDN